MHEIMVRPLPAGCRLTAIYDVSASLLIRILANASHPFLLDSHVTLEPLSVILHLF